MKPYNKITLRDLVNREIYDRKNIRVDSDGHLYIEPTVSAEMITVSFTITPTGALFESGGSC
jgi:hypothetical protein